MNEEGEERAAKKAASPLYLGFDFSTQQLKVVCVNNDVQITHEFIVKFDSDLPEFGTESGVTKHSDGLSVTSPTIMWVKALDVLFSKMKREGFPFGRVVGMSGCGQQHGSVYWREGSEEVLKNLNSDLTLAEQLKDCFSIPNSPIWMDSSTTQQCRQLEENMGGAQIVADRTGSRAYERFTGNQIAKIYQQRDSNPDYKNFDKTERISLVSSFGASLLAGCYAPIDYSDGSGMNLLDIETKEWWQLALDASAPNLKEMLGKPVPSRAVVGNVSKYFVDRYDFSSEAKVIAFTGDNPASLAGMRLQHGDVVISLGSSDTLFLWIDNARPQLMGHVFINPVDEAAYMALLCYKNGSFTRENVRDSCAHGNWAEFNTLLNSTMPGNDGNIGIYFHEPEITPSGSQGVFRFDKNGTQVLKPFPPEVEVRAVIEGQFLAKLSHARKLGYEISASSRVLATGGASTNTGILQVIADIFNTSVYVLEGTANSASLGGAYRAKHGLMPEGASFMDAVEGASSYKLAVKPNEEHHKVYLSLLSRYAEYEEQVAVQGMQRGELS